jgi:hypothetical protein
MRRVLMLAAALLLAASLSAYAANRDLADIDRNVVFLAGFALVGAVLSFRRPAAHYGAMATNRPVIPPGCLSAQRWQRRQR